LPSLPWIDTQTFSGENKDLGAASNHFLHCKLEFQQFLHKW
jgi:hypothetical protein